VDAFDCGQEALSGWLRKHALQNQSAGAAQTYVGLAGNVVIGYYSLAVGQIEYSDAPERLQKGLARHPVPIMLLARLAVDVGWQKRGVGRALLRDAVLRTVQAAGIAGIRALAVHAKDERARNYCERFDFAASLTDPLHLLALLKDIRRRVGAETSTEGARPFAEIAKNESHGRIPAASLTVKLGADDSPVRPRDLRGIGADFGIRTRTKAS
jgi:GNAT superfamily N-acetyltransferase